MLKVKSEMRHAIFMGDKQITDFCWTDIMNMGEYILVHNDEKLVLYNSKTGEPKLSVDSFDGYKLVENYLFIKSNGLWGVFTTHGKLIVPIEYEYIGECYANSKGELIAISVDTEFESGGYYIVAENKYYAADAINITKTDKIELKIKGEWIMLNN